MSKTTEGPDELQGKSVTGCNVVSSVPTRIGYRSMIDRTNLEIFEVSKYGFQAHASKPLPFNVWFDTTVELGRNDVSHLQSLVLRSNKEEPDGFYGFRLGEPDILWRKFVSALYHSKTYSDLETPTRFLR